MFRGCWTFLHVSKITFFSTQTRGPKGTDGRHETIYDSGVTSAHVELLDFLFGYFYDSRLFLTELETTTPFLFAEVGCPSVSRHLDPSTANNMAFGGPVTQGRLSASKVGRLHPWLAEGVSPPLLWTVQFSISRRWVSSLYISPYKESSVPQEDTFLYSCDLTLTPSLTVSLPSFGTWVSL